jgi:hypothetical protein
MIKPRLLGALRTCFLSLAFLFSGSASASTIFAPTDGDVNFLNNNISLTPTSWVAMFNVSDLGGTTNAVVLSDTYSASVALFSPSGGDFNVEVKNNVPPNDTDLYDTMTLSGSDNFILGLTTDGGENWTADTDATDLGGGFYRVQFSTGGNLLEVDVQVIPVPAALWLFGSGLIGLAGIARRSKSI